MKRNRFHRNPSKPSLYIKKEGNNFLMFYLYVDDLIYISNCDKMLIDFKNVTMDEFETSDLGLVRYFLGIQMKQKNINFLFIKRSMWLIC